ncbi:hypothetical protein J6590_058205 [Homalodisca vitripennis]|nr:hypothetical protein J6590_097090 [Homalodisca vitripennis]KAG8301210.1 hypothetical protein J6590_058205 [Homalodisca vitripennis]
MRQTAQCSTATARLTLRQWQPSEQMSTIVVIRMACQYCMTAIVIIRSECVNKHYIFLINNPSSSSTPMFLVPVSSLVPVPSHPVLVSKCGTSHQSSTSSATPRSGSDLCPSPLGKVTPISIRICPTQKFKMA